MQERLQKIIAAAGLTSRRKAEALIQEGRVKVNGQTVIELGSKANRSRDRITVDGRPLASTHILVYLLLNKPVGYVSTVTDPERRPTVLSLVRGIKERVYPVGRLDYSSSGIMLLTNDGDLANFLMSRASAVPRAYQVKIGSALSPGDVQKLERGVVLDGRRTAPAKVRCLGARTGREKPWYEITLVEGRYHQVRRMFEHVGQSVIKLKRVRIAFLSDNGLAPGQFRHLTPAEIRKLKAMSTRRTGKDPETLSGTAGYRLTSPLGATRSRRSGQAPANGEG
jgi:23S rRNA pseudouridine2605 synthase